MHLEERPLAVCAFQMIRLWFSLADSGDPFGRSDGQSRQWWLRFRWLFVEHAQSHISAGKMNPWYCKCRINLGRNWICLDLLQLLLMEDVEHKTPQCPYYCNVTSSTLLEITSLKMSNSLWISTMYSICDPTIKCDNMIWLLFKKCVQVKCLVVHNIWNLEIKNNQKQFLNLCFYFFHWFFYRLSKQGLSSF